MSSCSCASLPGEGSAELLHAIADLLGKESRRVKLLLPYDRAGLLDTLRREAGVLSAEYTDAGVAVDVVVKPELWGRVREFVQSEGEGNGENH